MSTTKFSQSIQIRWADIDANRHMRHSVYYDYGATARMHILTQHGLTTKKLEELMIGPILFREEAVFKREILFEDQITIDVSVIRATKDFSRWSLRHHFTKQDGTLATIINIDGAWIDMIKRKLAIPNQFIQDIFKTFPKDDAFEFINIEKK